MIIKTLRYTLIVFFFSQMSQANIDLSVDKFKLENGLTVLLHEDHKIPLYSLQIWYKVGSGDEDPNKTGLAHFFEHLMFKGTKNFKDGYFDNFIEENGGSNNAYTNQDMTVYHEDMPTKTLKTILMLEADRMQHLKVSEKNIQSEREVVIEERTRRVENSPFGRAFEALYDISYSDSSFYRWPVIGSMAHLRSATVQDFKDFYKKHYTPEKAILVISGSFDKTDAKKWIKDYFGPIPSQSSYQDHKSSATYKTNQYRKIKIQMNSSVLLYSFPGVTVYNDDRLALSLIHTALGDGSTSYLYKKLVDEQPLALSVGGYNSPLKHGGVQYIYASLRPGANVSKINNIIKQTLKNKVKVGLTQAELNSAVKKFKIQYYNQFKTLGGKASFIGEGEFYYGDYTLPLNYVEMIEDLNLKKVNSVFKKYFKVDSFNLVEVGS